MKLPGPMLQPQLRVRVMRGTYQGATVATLTTMGNVLQSVKSAKELDKCPKGRNQQNKGARGRAYVVVENPQQNPNVVAVSYAFALNPYR
uniref:Reverse transcriptase domain-containing protein n=1 Tax=Tanacetum cinerariifolium TaxID=118510 RepID=A0A699UK23_TANCI|nr:hypothetical protein [Tanacetum cinerariifolium]